MALGVSLYMAANPELAAILFALKVCNYVTTPKRKPEPPIQITADEWGLIRRQLAMSRDVLERFARLAEEHESSRLSTEEIRELIKELIEESSRWADGLSGRMDRLERYTILVRLTGGNQQTIEVEGKVAKEHIDRALREELVNQQNLLAQYQKNVAKVKMSIARYGETVPLMNELEEYETKLDKANEAIARIRQSLAA